MQESAKKELFASMKVGKAIRKLAVPAVLSQIILVAYNMADAFYIGLTGEEELITSIAICMPAFMFLSAISNLFGIGGGSGISRSLGKGKDHRAAGLSSFAFWACAAITAVYCLATLIWADPFVNLLGGSHIRVHEEAKTYLFLTVTCFGICAALNTLMSHLVRSEGNSLQASIGIMVGGVLNILLDPLFMFVILEPGKEVLGAAIATSLSNLIALFYYFVYLFIVRKKTVLTFLPSKIKINRKVLKEVFISGLPACLMTLFENVSFMILDNLMSANGVILQAGLGVAKKINMLSHSIVRGVSQGVLPLIAYNYASKNYTRMRSAFFQSAALSVGIATITMVLYLIFGPGLVSWFIQGDSPSIQEGAVILRILCIGGPFSAFAYAVISLFQATKRGFKALWLAMSRKGIIDIPLMFLLRLWIPTYGIVWATPIADMACCLIAVILLIVFLKFIRQKGDALIIQESPDVPEASGA